MENQTLEQAADKYIQQNGYNSHTRSTFYEGAEWQKEQLRKHMQEVIDTLTNDTAKKLVENVAIILFS